MSKSSKCHLQKYGPGQGKKKFTLRWAIEERFSEVADEIEPWSGQIGLWTMYPVREHEVARRVALWREQKATTRGVIMLEGIEMALQGYQISRSSLSSQWQGRPLRRSYKSSAKNLKPRGGWGLLGEGIKVKQDGIGVDSGSHR